mgnify:CR=1
MEFQFDPSRPSGSRVTPGSVLVGGQPLDEFRAYKVSPALEVAVASVLV